MIDGAVRAIFSFTARGMTRSVKGWLFGLLLGVPWAAALFLRLLIWRGVQVPLGGVTLYGILVLAYITGFLVPLSTLFFGTSLIADEVEGGTLPYLYGRPVRRERVYLAKVAAMVAVLVAGSWLSITGTYLLSLSIDGAGAVGREMGTLLGDLATTGLGVLAYGALFAFIGLAVKKPLFWGLIIGFGWENLVAWLPGFLKRLTLLFHLHTLLPHNSAPQGVIEQMLAASESRTAALVFLAVYTALFLVLGCALSRRMEAAAAEREEG
jgi:ABC-type transport system involved in multi-copper enzyme maturation permease subunit